MTKRKEDKLRPYRVDYFDVESMQGDKALVHYVLVRACTAEEAKEKLTPEPAKARQRIIIRARRFYKKLPADPGFVAVEKLFSDNKAVVIMEMVENLRKGSGPSSPQTQAVVADLKGMISHDAHEQAMDTFVPAPQPQPAATPKQLEKLTDSTPAVEPIKPIEQPSAPCPPSARVMTPTCPNCGVGIDSDGDGNCAVCASSAYKQQQVQEAAKALDDLNTSASALAALPPPKKGNKAFLWVVAGTTAIVAALILYYLSH